MVAEQEGCANQFFESGMEEFGDRLVSKRGSKRFFAALRMTALENEHRVTWTKNWHDQRLRRQWQATSGDRDRGGRECCGPANNGGARGLFRGASRFRRAKRIAAE